MHRIVAGLVAISCAAVVAACGRPAPLLSYPRYAAATPPATPQSATEDGRVTLREILDYADEHAPAISAARAGAARSDAARVAASPLVPSEPRVSMGIGTRRSSAGSTVEAEVSVEQELEIGGQRGLRLDAADAARDVEARRFEQARWQVHLDVHTAFHQALVARERQATAEQLVEFSERLLDVAGKRNHAGDISPLQVEVAEGELALARQELVDARAGYWDARLRLAELSGWPETRPPEPPGSLDRPRGVDDPEPLVAYALDHHPALRVRASEVAEADARVRVADREAWPNIVVGASYAREREPVAMSESQHIGMVTLTLPIPLFRRNRPARAAAEAAWITARAGEASTRRVVRVRVVRAVAAVNAAAARVESYGSEIIPSFASNMEKLVRAFELGEVDVLEVLVARGRYLELQRQALSAYADYFRAVAVLEGEIGGDVWPEDHHEHGDER